MNGSLPGSSVYGIFQPRIWEGVAIPSSMGSSRLIEPGSPTLQILCHLCHQQIIFMHKYIEYVCTYMCLHTQITNMYAQSVCNVYTPSVYICVCTQIQAYTCIHIHTHNICIYTWIVYIVSVCIHTHTHTHHGIPGDKVLQWEPESCKITISYISVSRSQALHCVFSPFVLEPGAGIQIKLLLWDDSAVW